MNAESSLGHEASGNFRRILMSMVVVGFVAAAAASTFATFTAQTANQATVANATVSMTNVVGTLLNGESALCSSATGAGLAATTCNIAFKASNASTADPTTAGLTNLKPGGGSNANTVAITYKGSIAASLSLFSTSYSTTSGTGFCTAANPGDKVNLTIAQGATTIFPNGTVATGTLDAFKTAYFDSAHALPLYQPAGTLNTPWNTNDAATFTITVSLDASADNTYQGCQETLGFNWYAVQQ